MGAAGARGDTVQFPAAAARTADWPRRTQLAQIRRHRPRTRVTFHCSVKMGTALGITGKGLQKGQALGSGRRAAPAGGSEV